jgi:proteasome accessory factor C
MSTRITADEQLQRILHILPAAARNGGISIEELAGELDVAADRLLADIEEATNRTFHHAGGTVDPFTIFTDGRRVEVFASHDFNRPVRLNRRETLALTLGLRALALEAEPHRRDGIMNFARRLEAAVCAPDTLPSGDGTVPQAPAGARGSAGGMGADQAGGGASAEDGVEYEAFDLDLGADEFRGAIVDAVADGVQCEIWYLKPGEVEPEKRRIAPHRLIHADGAWYVAATDLEREGLRFFRMDRVLEASPVAGRMAPPEPPGFDEWIRGAPFVAAEHVPVAVRYHARIARWITERNGATPEQDGSVVVEHRVSDMRWVVRHVMQYGGAAVVESPGHARSHVGSTVRAIMAQWAGEGRE